MKKIIILFFSLFFVTLMFAQGSYTSSETDKANKMTQQMKNTLGLNQAQVNQVQVINLEVVKRLDNAMLNSEDKVLLKNKVQAINLYRDTEIKKVLTPQQFTVLKSNTNGKNCR